VRFAGSQEGGGGGGGKEQWKRTGTFGEKKGEMVRGKTL